MSVPFQTCVIGRAASTSSPSVQAGVGVRPTKAKAIHPKYTVFKSGAGGNRTFSFVTQIAEHEWGGGEEAAGSHLSHHTVDKTVRKNEDSIQEGKEGGREKDRTQKQESKGARHQSDGPDCIPELHRSRSVAGCAVCRQQILLCVKVLRWISVTCIKMSITESYGRKTEWYSAKTTRALCSVVIVYTFLTKPIWVQSDSNALKNYSQNKINESMA